jgi:hypothetical protein
MYLKRHSHETGPQPVKDTNVFSIVWADFGKAGDNFLKSWYLSTEKCLM